MSDWSDAAGGDAERIRLDALDALGASGDPGVHAAIASAEIAVVPAGVGWGAGSGALEGDRLILAVDAETLGRAITTPSVVDAFAQALSVAIARRAGRALVAFRLVYAQRLAPVAGAAYRGPSPRPPAPALAASLAAVARGAGKAALAEALLRARVVAEGSEGPLVVVPATEADADAIAAASSFVQTADCAVRDPEGIDPGQGGRYGRPRALFTIEAPASAPRKP